MLLFDPHNGGMDEAVEFFRELHTGPFTAWYLLAHTMSVTR
jgi:hypothetical protein